MTLASTHTASETEFAGPKSSFWKPFLIAFLLAQAVGGLGALTTDLGMWYQSLNKPWWQPPDWLFGPAWTTIFALAALSAVYAWRNAATKSSRETIILLFTCNAFFNLLWSLSVLPLQTARFGADRGWRPLGVGSHPDFRALTLLEDIKLAACALYLLGDFRRNPELYGRSAQSGALK